MRFTFAGRGITLSDRLKEQVQLKLGKLDKYFSEDTEARVTLLKEGDMAKIEVTIPTKIGLIRAEDANKDLDTSIDKVEEIIEKQIKKFKNRLIDKKQSATPFSAMFMEAPVDVDYDDEIRIVKTKRFPIKPMDAEEACLQMEMLGHDFYVFLNSETDEINVVYKRKGGAYGLIEPTDDDE